MLRFLTLATPNFQVFIFHFFLSFFLNPNNAQVFLSGILGILQHPTFFTVPYPNSLK